MNKRNVVYVTNRSRGPRVELLQKAVNHQLHDRNFPWRDVKVDSKAGRHTFDAAHMAGFLMGFSVDQLKSIGSGHITEYTYEILTHKRRRSVAMKIRDRSRRDDAEHLRKKHRYLKEHHDPNPGAGTTEFDGHEVATWIVVWLEKSRKAGWNGSVISGFRSPEYSTSLCVSMCGASSCLGRCAGAGSNHSCPPSHACSYPEGAVDVSDQYNFADIQRRIGSPLQNNLPSDRLHFSASGY